MIRQILVNGVLASGLYALLAIGFSLIFGVARIVNLAHTAFYMIAAYYVYLFANLLSINILLSVALAILFTTLMGVVMYKLFIEPVKEHGPLIILTMGLAVVLQELTLLFYGGDVLTAPSFLSGYVEFLKVRASLQHVLTLAAFFVFILAVWGLLFKSKLGVGIRATAQDPEIAGLMGINVGRMCLVTMAISTFLAAVAGVVIAPISILEPYMWGEPLIIVIAIVVLGGMGSIKGSIIGALILGFVETLVVFIIPGGSFIKGATALAIVVFILWSKPEGLFGVVFEEERL